MARGHNTGNAQRSNRRADLHRRKVAWTIIEPTSDGRVYRNKKGFELYVAILEFGELGLH
jgi:hypothetical protein